MTMLRNALPPQMTVDEWQSAVKTVTICAMGIVFGLTLCLACFFRNYVDPTVLTVVASTTTGLFSYLFGRRTPVTEPPKTVEVKPTTESEIKS